MTTDTTPTMTAAELREALFGTADIPEGATGVRTIENDWVDSIDTARNDSAFWDGAETNTFAWDFTGRDDTAADLARNGL